MVSREQDGKTKTLGKVILKDQIYVVRDLLSRGRKHLHLLVFAPHMDLMNVSIYIIVNKPLFLALL